jgi:large subunit ribosomal protein L5
MTAASEKSRTTKKEELQKSLRLKNIHQVPRLQKVVVNIGMGKILGGADSHQRETLLNEITKCLSLITGQKPEMRPAKKSIAGFKLRQGDAAGLRVTLRKQRMEDFVNRLVKLVFPRVRDFRGLSLKLVDSQGIFNIGLKEHIVFPELSQEEFKKLYGLEITLVPTTRNRDQAIALYRAYGFPFQP